MSRETLSRKVLCDGVWPVSDSRLHNAPLPKPSAQNKRAAIAIKCGSLRRSGLFVFIFSSNTFKDVSDNFGIYENKNLAHALWNWIRISGLGIAPPISLQHSSPCRTFDTYIWTKSLRTAVKAGQVFPALHFNKLLPQHSNPITLRDDRM